MRSDAKKERNAKIVELYYDHNMPVSEIARLCGVIPRRIYEIITREVLRERPKGKRAASRGDALQGDEPQR